ncbi:unnamed protein product [Parnassius mnemosyne]|uniref:Uncharacterized protein n=1 Tax=Parnassius mnemosyne TaxID=213953 RepID=A0AAV1L1F8_9NEOP
MSSPSKNRFKKQTSYKRLMYKRLSVTKWLPDYNSEKAVADLIAFRLVTDSEQDEKIFTYNPLVSKHALPNRKL